MNASSTSITSPSKTLLSGWERALLILPALAALVLGLFPLLLPKPFADLSQFSPKDEYIYRLAGAATLGYGVALIIGSFQKEWRIVRLTVIGTLIFNLASLYACGSEIFRGNAPYSVYFVLVCSILFVTITSLLLARHSGVPQLEADAASSLLRIFLIVGAIAAGLFGVLPLFVPWFFKIFHFNIDAPFILQQAGAASLGYAVIAVLAQRVVNSRELLLIGVMAAIFNGAGGLASLPYILDTNILPLPQLIAPVGLLVLVGSLLFLRQAMIQKER
jgi:hypothetical protein